MTTPRGPRRTLYLFQNASGDSIFLMHRPKGDPIGDNMAYTNQDFRSAVDKATRAAAEDMEAGEFEVIESQG